MKKTISLILIVALSLASISLAAEDTWTTKADMPTVRWELSTCVVDGKIYAIGGAGPVYQALRTVEVYNPATDTWTTKSEMPTARQGLSTSVVNGRIYAIGGSASSSSGYSTSSVKNFSTVEEYDPETDTWATKSEMPTARGYHSANVVDGRIYVIGGSRWAPGSGSILTVEVYEPTTDTWTQEGDMPASRSAGFTSVVDGKIYGFGGYGRRRVDEYDPVTDTWTEKANMPTYRTALSTSTLDGKIYAIGGYVPGVSGYPGVATVEVYDPATDTWTTAPDMPTGRFGPRTSVVDGKIYVIGGMGSWIRTAYGTVEEYDIGLTVSSPDFNADGIVDSLDICIMVDHWGTDEPLCDLAPPPYGDGIIDVQDLIVLSEHLFTYPGAVAYWKLDETEGIVVADSAGDNNGYAIGNPIWQPTGGIVDGALELDGIDDCVTTDSVLNPVDGSFSAYAWVKGGTSGQVVLSQISAANWLLADPSEGNLMTELKSHGRAGKPMLSQTNITDGSWHRIGFVWDGSNRTLYVDGVTVAQDTQDGLEGSDSGLYIGCGKTMELGTFFSGLIDDVRIYNRAVTP